jgi:ArsR family transcriptional regulator, arsenate/arsenite/antimonite-responsive transcriptional repressor
MGQPSINIFRACIPLFQALGDPARQDIILMLTENEQLSVNEIANRSELSRPAISHHLKILRDNDLVNIEQQGTQRNYSLALNKSIDLLKELINTVETSCDLNKR